MKCAGLEPTKDQSRLAAAIGKPCKPQNIQHLLDPNNEVSTTKYLLDLADVLQCDPFWLGKGKGVKPTVRGDDAAMGTSFARSIAAQTAASIAAEPFAPYLVWPFKKFTAHEFNELDDALKESFENTIAAVIGNRGHPEKQQTPAKQTATG